MESVVSTGNISFTCFITHKINKKWNIYNKCHKRKTISQKNFLQLIEEKLLEIAPVNLNTFFKAVLIFFPGSSTPQSRELVQLSSILPMCSWQECSMVIHARGKVLFAICIGYPLGVYSRHNDAQCNLIISNTFQPEHKRFSHVCSMFTNVCQH